MYKFIYYICFVEYFLMKILENIIPIPYQGTDLTYEIRNLPNITKIIILKTIGNKIIIIL